MTEQPTAPRIDSSSASAEAVGVASDLTEGPALHLPFVFLRRSHLDWGAAHFSVYGRTFAAMRRGSLRHRCVRRLQNSLFVTSIIFILLITSNPTRTPGNAAKRSNRGAHALKSSASAIGSATLSSLPRREHRRFIITRQPAKHDTLRRRDGRRVAPWATSQSAADEEGTSPLPLDDEEASGCRRPHPLRPRPSRRRRFGRRLDGQMHRRSVRRIDADQIRREAPAPSWPWLLGSPHRLRTHGLDGCWKDMEHTPIVAASRMESSHSSVARSNLRMSFVSWQTRRPLKGSGRRMTPRRSRRLCHAPAARAIDFKAAFSRR